VAQGIDPEFKPQYHKKRKKRKENPWGKKPAKRGPHLPGTK
jgi:hypothetical protein